MIFTKPGFPSLLAAMLALLVSGLLLATGAPAVPDAAQDVAQSAVFPLDDAYIHLQYAWQAAQGQFLQYNPGDTPTTGATSLLYMLLVALGFALGVSRTAMPAVILGAGVFCFALTAAVVADAARRLGERLGLNGTLTGLLAGLWYAGNGWMAWAFLSGMETGWLMLFISGALWALLTRRPALAAACTALAVVTRPEALILAVAVLFAEVVMPTRGQVGGPKRLALRAAPLLAVFVSPVVNWLFSSSASATGFLAKSWFTTQPFHLDSIMRSIGLTLFELVVRLVGGLSPDGHWHAFPLLQVFVVAGLWNLLREGAGTAGARVPRADPKALRTSDSAARTVLVACLWSGGLLAATATLQTATWHHYRYQMPAYPALVLVGSVGLGSLLSRARRWATTLLLAAAVIWSATSVAGYARAYARDTRTVAGMQIPLAHWLRENTPADARVVVHDVGVMRFLGERTTIDAVGLTTRGSVDAYRNGPGALYELLEKVRPDYYAVYTDLAPPYFGIATAPDLLGTELFRIQLPDTSPYVSAMDTQVVTQPDWSMSDLTPAPRQPDVVARIAGLTLVDVLDIADLDDEQAHAYTWWNASRFPGFISDARRMTYRQDETIELADGGRIFDGGQAFTLAARPSEPLLLVGRFHQPTDLALHVDVNGEDAGAWRLPAIPGQWLESTFLIPADLVDGDTAHIALTVSPDVPGARCSPFHLWAYQGEIAAPTPPDPTMDAAVDFGSVAQLVGYDLPEVQVAPDSPLPLALYWRVLDAPRADWHIFVHLMDPENDTTEGIVVQWDTAPSAGTHPFWAWQPDEVGVEPVYLFVPDDVAPGEYALLVGVYDLATGERASLDPALDFGANRLRLATITVE